MVWKVEFHADMQIIELFFSGPVSGPELLAAAAARIDAGKEMDVDKYLIDATAMQAPLSMITDVLEIPENVYFEKDMDRNSCIAVVAPSDPDSSWIAEFYENASVLRGWRVKNCGDREAAIAWLQNSG